MSPIQAYMAAACAGFGKAHRHKSNCLMQPCGMHEREMLKSLHGKSHQELELRWASNGCDGQRQFAFELDYEMIML